MPCWKSTGNSVRAKPANLENAAQLIKNIFSDNRRYDLANVGRYKVNRNWAGASACWAKN